MLLARDTVTRCAVEVDVILVWRSRGGAGTGGLGELGQPTRAEALLALLARSNSAKNLSSAAAAQRI